MTDYFLLPKMGVSIMLVFVKLYHVLWKAARMITCIIVLYRCSIDSRNCSSNVLNVIYCMSSRFSIKDIAQKCKTNILTFKSYQMPHREKGYNKKWRKINKWENKLFSDLNLSNCHRSLQKSNHSVFLLIDGQFCLFSLSFAKMSVQNHTNLCLTYIQAFRLPCFTSIFNDTLPFKMAGVENVVKNVKHI